MMKVAAIIQARMGSTRLPGKILKKVLGKTLLEYQIERVKRSQQINQIIIATTTKDSDDPIVQLCDQLSIPYYRGSEEDVLSRYYEAAKMFKVDVIVRLTSDCPIIDPAVIDKVIKHYLNNKDQFDYVSNTLVRTFPRGMDTEVLPIEILENALLNSKEPVYREHVTSYIYHHPNLFKLGNVTHVEDLSHNRWTVDTEEDFQLIKNILNELYPINTFFNMTDVVELMDKNPSWFKINSHVEQKKLSL